MAEDTETPCLFDNPLCIAVHEGSEERIKELIDELKWKINDNCKGMHTPLILAVKKGHLHILELLVSSKWIDINARATYYTALCVACRYNKLDIVKRLLKHPRINVNWTFPTDNPVVIAIRYEHFDILKLLLMHPTTTVDMTNMAYIGDSILEYCAHHLNEKAVEILLEYFSNFTNSQKEKAMIKAGSGGGMDIIMMILASSPDLSVENVVIHKAMRMSCAKDLHWLEDYKSDPKTTCERLRVITGLNDLDIAKVFVMGVMLCDRYFTVTKTATVSGRFFAIIEHLPMEIQMILCNLKFGMPSSKIISSQQVEEALCVMLCQKMI